MKKIPVVYILLIIFLVTSGCGYKATLGRPWDKEETPDEYLEIDGWRLKSGTFRIISSRSEILTGEAKIVKNEKEHYYLFLSENFSIEEGDGNVVYLSTNPILHTPSDLTDKYSLGELQKNSGFQW